MIHLIMKEKFIFNITNRGRLNMKFLFMTTMALGVVLTLENHQVSAASLTPAIATDATQGEIILARGGCGWGFHRTWNGGCARNGGYYYGHPYWGHWGWRHWGWHHWHRW